jgi:uncharacterized protein
LTNLDRGDTVVIVVGQMLDRKEPCMKSLDLLSGTLLVVGGLNWGLVALAEFDLVATLVGLEFGETNWASRLVYGLVGLAAVYGATRLPVVARRREAVTA